MWTVGLAAEIRARPFSRRIDADILAERTNPWWFYLAK
jgi:hypothetical protein